VGPARREDDVIQVARWLLLPLLAWPASPPRRGRRAAALVHRRRRRRHPHPRHGGRQRRPLRRRRRLRLHPHARAHRALDRRGRPGHLPSGGNLSPTNTGLSYYPRFVGPTRWPMPSPPWATTLARSRATTPSTAGSRAWRTPSHCSRSGASPTKARPHRGRAPARAVRRQRRGRGPPRLHLRHHGLPLPTGTNVNIIDREAILDDAAWARAHGPSS